MNMPANPQLRDSFDVRARSTPTAVSTSLAAAQQHAQVAVAVELYTIPLYLSALASINTSTGSAAQSAYAAVLSVCTEEMLHLQLAANICLALGTTPNFTAPVYGQVPSFPDGTPILDPTDPATGDSGILNARIGNLVDLLPTMLDIEVPTEFETGALVPPYHSIGQMYDALKGLARLARSSAPWTTANQQSYFNTQAFPQVITNYQDLVTAIDVICEQGEGKAQSPPPNPPFTPQEFMIPDVADRLVGMSSDPPGQAEYSHFGRFLAVQALGLTTANVYTGTSAPASQQNVTLQTDFANLIASMNTLWTTGQGNIWSMTNLLTDAVKVWQAGNVPQWTPASFS
ncbi:ferritin-like protein [Tahibacter amnicola]|uniref:Ferritin-like protein n=1 Tax=Tahibacter amnicola TaxID=2976241 RepID=A0ABY6BKZ4_9GAMM|nr:ferritin-like protein [Tahibacter amnicola]UXI70093.1 ferritin-like protein [Tahibacter amnicola]